MNQDRTIPDRAPRAAIILAGGEGTRLAELTRGPDGVHVPKQFYALLGETPLLEQTRKRVLRSFAPDQIFFVLNQEHERFFTPLLLDVPKRNLVIQPTSRGTAPAILYSLLRLAESTPQASVLLLPSDHHVRDEAALIKHIDVAFAAVDENPQMTVLLGLTAQAPETGYGWIERGITPTSQKRNIFPVRQFWEKPSRELANQLMAEGCLWNSLMLVGRLPTLIGLFTLAMPGLYASFAKIRASLGTGFEKEIVRRLFEDLRASDFSSQVLQAIAGRLSVVPVGDIGWSDLGDPQRLAKVLAKLEGQQDEVAA